MIEQTFDTLAVVKYDVSEAMIEETRQRYAALEATTPEGYEEVRQAIAFVRGKRVSIEKKRVEFKAVALEYGRKVDAEARRWTSLIESIEDPLVAKKQAIDDERERVRAEREQKRLAEIEAQLQAEREAEEARLRSIREAEEARLAQERAKLAEEQARLADERAELDRERAEANAAREAARAQEEAAAKAQRDREDADRKAEDERLRLERVELERQRRELEERKAAEVAAEAERVAAEAKVARLVELQPDIQRLAVFADKLRAIRGPAVKSELAQRYIDIAVRDIAAIADRMTSLEKIERFS